MPWSETLATLTPRVIFDILLISLLIQRVLALFRGTVALVLACIGVALWLLYVAATALGLILTSTFLLAAAPFAAFVIIVAFRNEIRDVLNHTNPARLLLGHASTKISGRRLDEVCEGLFRMAEERTGALIVFQLRDPLLRLVQGGVVLGGQLSDPILRTIFAKETPVHDGAVVVRGHKIEKVGTILPLSNRADLPGQYGTRHRAALGLSEQADSVVVVVSEERGEVSVVHRGVISTAESPADLGRSLRLLLGTQSEGPRLKLLRREIGRQLGVFALTLAVVSTYWLVRYGSHISVTTVTVPIEYRNLPDGFELGGVAPESLEIQLRGPGPSIEGLKLHSEQVNVSVDLKSVQTGRGRTIHLDESNFELPVGVSVDRFNPTSLTIDLERRTTKTVPILPRITSPIPDGYDPVVVPETVTLVGPSSAVVKIESIESAPVVLPEPAEGEEEVSAPVVLALPRDNRIRFGADQPREVRVFLRRRPDPPPAETAPEPSPADGSAAHDQREEEAHPKEGQPEPQE